jgi:hypothetical protein
MIDKNPQVGRYLLKDTIWIHGFCHRGGLITKISGKRIYIDCEYGSPGSERVESEYVNKFAAICDTREEMQMLLDHAMKCMVEHREQEKRNLAEWRAFFSG